MRTLFLVLVLASLCSQLRGEGLTESCPHDTSGRCLICAPDPADPGARRIRAHLRIGDLRAAKEEAGALLDEYPDSAAAHEIYIVTLSRLGEERALAEAWKRFAKTFPDEAFEDSLLEEMAWGVVGRGTEARQPMTRLMALLAAFMGRDIRGVDLVHDTLHDHDAYLRAVAAQVSGKLGDTKLRDKLLTMLETERSPHVRLEVIRTLGRLGEKRAHKPLMELLSSPRARFEEQAIAAEALVYLVDDLTESQLKQLVRSSRAGLRLFACQIAVFLDLEHAPPLIARLTSDTNSSVRAAALNALHLLGADVVESAGEALDDGDPLVSTTAAWLLAIRGEEQGKKALVEKIRHGSRENRYLAAAAIGALGEGGTGFMRQQLAQSDDLFVDLNLAVGLIGQRAHLDEACKALHLALDSTLKLASERHGPFEVIAPHKPGRAPMVGTTEMADQVTRLELLALLATINPDEASVAIKTFLKHHQWGITGMAAALLLQEGPDDTLDIVRGLLDDEDNRVRIQAALILAMWGRDPQAIATLQEAYETAPRRLKEQILDALGRVGDKKSLPFLVDRLGEAYRTLRLIAAVGIIETING